MVDYPIVFSSKSESSKEDEGWHLKTEEGLETSMTAPEQFGGDSEEPSPEDLFNASLGSCILATFKVTAGRKNLEYGEIEVDSNTELDRNEDGRPVMKKADINLNVKEVSDRELAEEVAEITERNCFIHNSVRTSVKTKFSFT